MKLQRNIAACLLLVGGLGAARSQVITDFNPKFGSPGEYVTITGTGFYYTGMTVNPVVEVQFNTTTAPGFYVTADTQISVPVPPGATSGLIRVRKASGGWVYSPQSFTVIGPGPYISGFTPANGGAGTLVFINGTHFTGATAVRFNGVAAPGFFVAADTQIQVNAPANVTTGPITVERTGVGTNTSSARFNVQPVILGFSPATGRAGTNVVLTGQNFLGTTEVLFNGLAASFVPPTNNTTLVATVPAGATTGPMRVTAAAGPYPTSSNFVVQPTISGFTPTTGPVGTSITVTGANFTAANLQVFFNGVPAAAPTGVSFGQLTAVVPSTTTGPITVTTADGSATSAQDFHLPARITGFAPTNSAPGTRITVTGINFSNALAVAFNGLPAAFTVTNNTTLGATVPAGVTTGPITLTTPAGTTNSGSLLFYALPAIESFTPIIGRPGTNVTLIGTNFLGATAVRFNGTNASFTVVNSGQITTVVPTNARSGPISVVAPAGTNVSAGSFTVDYQANLGVSITDTPDPVLLGSALVYTVVVTNRGPFAAPATVLSNTLPTDVLLQSATTTQGSVNTDANPIIASLGTLNAGASATLTLTVTPQEAGWITNLAGVASGYPDPSGGDNAAQAATRVLPAPYLSIQRVADNRLRVTWPVELTNFILQFRPDLSATNAWLNTTSTVTISGDRRGVTETNAAPSRFYRLAQ